MAIYDIGLLRLSKEERKDSQTKAFKEYPLLGVSVLDGLEETTLIKMAKEVILFHQENWDGSGYPKGLKGEAIPLSAQIASIAHLYDELTIPKVYSPNKCSSEEALETIKRENGVKFNPALLTLFVENFEQFKEIKNRLS
jgi:response regulator RpfG family c-di-GMP phosphodiesterase